jgi:hypothetical protein
VLDHAQGALLVRLGYLPEQVLSQAAISLQQPGECAVGGRGERHDGHPAVAGFGLPCDPAVGLQRIDQAGDGPRGDADRLAQLTHLHWSQGMQRGHHPAARIAHPVLARSKILDLDQPRRQREQPPHDPLGQVHVERGGEVGPAGGR